MENTKMVAYFTLQSESADANWPSNKAASLWLSEQQELSLQINSNKHMVKFNPKNLNLTENFHVSKDHSFLKKKIVRFKTEWLRKVKSTITWVVQ